MGPGDGKPSTFITTYRCLVRWWQDTTVQAASTILHLHITAVDMWKAAYLAMPWLYGDWFGPQLVLAARNGKAAGSLSHSHKCSSACTEKVLVFFKIGKMCILRKTLHKDIKAEPAPTPRHHQHALQTPSALGKPRLRCLVLLDS